MKPLIKFFSMIAIFALTITLAGMPVSLVHASSVLYVEPGATGNCSSWSNACTLQTALVNAASGDEIWVTSGIYKPTTGSDRTATFQLKSGLAVYGGFAGSETARNQRNWTTHVVILSGDLLGNDSGTFGHNDENSYHVVTGADNATLDGVTISGGNSNAAPPNYTGGGMYNASESKPTLTNVTFSGNSAVYGGGMQNDGGNPILTNVTFSGNRANNGGGGMDNESGNPTLTNVTFSGNVATGGGGMENGEGGNLTLTNVTFQGNTAGYGGGMINSLDSSCQLTNVTFSGNSVSTHGSGMYNEGWSNLLLTNVTLSGNSGIDGIYNNSHSSVNVRNSILWGDSGSEIINTDFTSSATVTYSDVQGGHLGMGNINSDPLFTTTVPSAPSTGGNLRPSSGSPAINHGNNSVTDPNLPATDLDGHARIIGGTVDMGAYEYDTPQAGPALVVNTNADRDDGVCGNADCTLREAINKANNQAGANTITFNIGDGATILLNSGLPGITDTSGTTTIDGGTHSITISGNHLVEVFYVNSGVAFSLQTLTVANGQGYEGGGMYNASSNTMLNNITFNSNSATALGGGMYNYNANPTLTNVTFSSNSAPYGGGIYNDHSSPMLTNITFIGNTAGYGGGMENYSSNLTLTNVTFNGNSASSNGGGMYNAYSSPKVRNSIVWGDSGGEIVNDNSTSTVSYSVVQGGYTGGTNIITTSPLLGTLGNYGGNTQTIPLLPGSSAINAGNSTYCSIGHDQRGVNYVGKCDIGAFESHGITLTKTGGDSQSTKVNTAFAHPLTLTVTNAYSEPVNGGVITFTAPASGASTNPAKSTATIASGSVSRSVSANGTAGSYNVTASASGASGSLSFALTNTPPDLTLTPPSLNFGNQLIGTTSATKVVTLKNTGSATLNVGTLTITTPYKFISNTCNGKALAPAANCTFKVAFAPTATGATTGKTVTIPSNATTSPNQVTLSGTGVAGTQLLSNADFETDANNDKKPDNWIFTNFSISTDQRDCTVYYSGSCSLKLVGNNSQKTAYQTITKSGVAGDEYTFALWSDASSVPSGATFQLQVQFFNGSTVISTKTLSFTTGTHAFEKVSGTFTATSAYTKITFTIVFKAASGTVWFDAAALNYAP